MTFYLLIAIVEESICFLYRVLKILKVRVMLFSAVSQEILQKVYFICKIFHSFNSDQFVGLTILILYSDTSRCFREEELILQKEDKTLSLILFCFTVLQDLNYCEISVHFKIENKLLLALLSCAIFTKNLIKLDKPIQSIPILGNSCILVSMKEFTRIPCDSYFVLFDTLISTLHFA